MTLRRYVARARGAVAGAIVWLGVVASYDGASAQVGPDPARSAFRDIRIGSGPIFFGGYVGGDRGRAGAGPANGLTFGVRYDLALGRSVLMQLSQTYLRADRYIIDPEASATSAGRRTGPVDTDLLLSEIALQLRLTGPKSWRGLAPFLGVGLGMAFDVNSPGDATGSGYEFGSKFLVSGVGGVRWHAGRRVTVHADARALFWRLKYPVSFRSVAPDGTRVIALSEPLTDWTIHPWVSLGVGWTF